MNAADILEKARLVLSLIAQAEELVPQIVADLANLKGKLSSDDDRVIRDAITSAHGLSQSLTAQINDTADDLVIKPEPRSDSEPETTKAKK